MPDYLRGITANSMVIAVALALTVYQVDRSFTDPAVWFFGFAMLLAAQVREVFVIRRWRRQVAAKPIPGEEECRKLLEDFRVQLANPEALLERERQSQAATEQTSRTAISLEKKLESMLKQADAASNAGLDLELKNQLVKIQNVLDRDLPGAHPMRVPFMLTMAQFPDVLHGNVALALDLARNALAIQLATCDSVDCVQSSRIAHNLLFLGALETRSGQYEDADRYYQIAAEAFKGLIAVQESGLTRESDQIPSRELLLSFYASALSHHSEPLRKLGRLTEAKELLFDAQRLYEGELSEDYRGYATHLNNMSDLHLDKGLPGQAEACLQKALLIVESRLPEDTELHGKLQYELAIIRKQGDKSSWRFLDNYAVEHLKQHFQQDDLRLATINMNQAIDWFNAGDLPKSENCLDIAEDILRKQSADEGYLFANLLVVRAKIMSLHERYDKAEDLLRSALRLREKCTPGHINVAQTHFLLSGAYAGQALNGDASHWYYAGIHAREAVEILRQAWAQRLWSGGDRAATRRENFIVERYLHYLARYAPVAGRNSMGGARNAEIFPIMPMIKLRKRSLRDFRYASVSGRDSMRDDTRVAEIFSTMQLARLPAAALAAQRMAIRFAAKSDELGEQVREREQLQQKLLDIEKKLMDANGPGSGSLEDYDDMRKRLDAVTAELRRDFPDYASLMSLAPLSLDEARALLQPEEILIMVVTHDQHTAVLAIDNREGLEFHYSDTSSEHIAGMVATVRQHMVSLSKNEALKKSLNNLDVFLAADGFPLMELSELYEKIFKPVVEPLCASREDNPEILLVLDGALSQLPPGLLLTQPPDRPVGNNCASLRDQHWWIKQQALTVLPSVGTLALRSVQQRKADQPSKQGQQRPFLGSSDPIAKLYAEFSASLLNQETEAIVVATRSQQRPFLGIGDPMFTAPDEKARAEKNDPQTILWCKVAGLEKLEYAEDELKRLARHLGADHDRDLRLGKNASVARLREEKGGLKQYKILAFSTHALVADELGLPHEASLVLTPPDHPDPDDTGLLTASEIAQFNLNADWVILSACNTAAAANADRLGEGLSGLARAFFYAGARALLVSQWPVDDRTSIYLTTEMLRHMKEKPISRAEALRQAACGCMDAEDVQFLHPYFWAPFVVAG